MEMPIIREVQDRLELAFPKSADVQLLRAVQEGSFLADHLFDGEAILNNALGRDLRGHVRRIGISKQIDLYCMRGDLPFVSAMKPMPKGRWHWLEIVGTGAVAHVCRTDDIWEFPQEAESRQDFRLTLQPSLLTWMSARKSMAQIVQEIPKLYGWLTFRVAQDGRVSHLCWGAPAADSDEYIGHINILDRIAKSGGQLVPANPTPDPKDRLRLKEHIEQALEEKRSDEKSD
jgi:hypothetical protein